MVDHTRPKVVIIGAGFGGLKAARTLAGKPVDVLLVDKNNFHTFTPLLYQVATCGLNSSEIAYPVRSIIRKDENVNFLLGKVEEIDYNRKQLVIRENGTTRTKSYDYLIVAAGTVTNYFNNEDIEKYSFGLKDLADSVNLRNHILKNFEKAAWVEDPEKRDALMTMVVVGGGPTGIETAGALFELYNYVLAHEYKYARPDDQNARVILVEATNRLLAPYPARLQESALKQLRSLGVEVILEQAVQDVSKDSITLSNGRVIRTRTLVWAAGVKTSPIAAQFDVELQRGGRIPVTPSLELPQREGVYVVGDLAYLQNEEGNPYPQVIPVAQQQGQLAAENILRHINGEAGEAFKYSDRGMMATIGRKRAVAWPFYRIQLTGYFAWATWLILHLVWLLGFRNRISVFINWMWNYVTYDRSVRIILDRYETERAETAEQPVYEQNQNLQTHEVVSHENVA